MRERAMCMHERDERERAGYACARDARETSASSLVRTEPREEREWCAAAGEGMRDGCG